MTGLLRARRKALRRRIHLGTRVGDDSENVRDLEIEIVGQVFDHLGATLPLGARRLLFRGEAFGGDRVFLEDFDRSGHFADLVRAILRRNRDVPLACGEAAHDAGHLADRRGDHPPADQVGKRGAGQQADAEDPGKQRHLPHEEFAEAVDLALHRLHVDPDALRDRIAQRLAIGAVVEGIAIHVRRRGALLPRHLDGVGAILDERREIFLDVGEVAELFRWNVDFPLGDIRLQRVEISQQRRRERLDLLLRGRKV